MKRYEMVKSHEEFNEIINKGEKKSNKYMIIFSLKKDFSKPNFGIAVGKKIGNAVERNKLKRQFRNIIDNNRFCFQNYHNYIIMIKKEAKSARFIDIENSLKTLLGDEKYEK